MRPLDESKLLHRHRIHERAQHGVKPVKYLRRLDENHHLQSFRVRSREQRHALRRHARRHVPRAEAMKVAHPHVLIVRIRRQERLQQFQHLHAVFHVARRLMIHRESDVRVHDRPSARVEPDLLHVVAPKVSLEASLASHVSRPRRGSPRDRLSQPFRRLRDVSLIRPQEPLARLARAPRVDVVVARRRERIRDASSHGVDRLGRDRGSHARRDGHLIAKRDVATRRRRRRVFRPPRRARAVRHRAPRSDARDAARDAARDDAGAIATRFSAFQ